MSSAGPREGRAGPAGSRGGRGADEGLVSSRGFTFKKASGSSALPREPRGLPAAPALRDKDVNTSSLAAPPSPCPAAKDRKTQIQDFFPAAVSAHGRGPEPAGVSPALTRFPEVSKGLSVSGKRGVPGGLRGAPAVGPVIAIEDEWDDIDDFELSGIEKKHCRPAGPPRKGLRVSHVSSQRSSPCPDQPPGSPQTVGDDKGSHSRGASEHRETSVEAEEQPLSQQSLICLEDSAPCSSNRAVDEELWENLSADVILDDDREEAHPGNDLFRSAGEPEEYLSVLAQRACVSRS